MSKTESTASEEIENIINALGRSDLTEGKVRGTHLGKVLSYLQMKKKERYQDTIYKLSLVLGVNIRYIRENFLKGLELFGVIKITMISNEYWWNWIGDKSLETCFLNNGSETEETLTEHAEKKPHPLKKQCLNCGKGIPEALTYCSDDCMRAYKNRKENQ